MFSTTRYDEAEALQALDNGIANALAYVNSALAMQRILRNAGRHSDAMRQERANLKTALAGIEAARRATNQALPPVTDMPASRRA